MARAKNIYYVFPKKEEDSPHEWKPQGAANHGTELCNNESRPIEPGERTAEGGKAGTPEAPSKGLKATAAASEEGKFAMPTLAAGEVVTGVKLYARIEQGTAGTEAEWGIVGSGIGKTNTVGQTSIAWVFVAPSRNEVQTAAQREALKFFLKWKKGTTYIFELCLVLETETEAAIKNTTLGQSHSSDVANSEGKRSGAVTYAQVGFTAIMAVTCINKAAAAVKDTAGSTWQLDGEVTQGIKTVQVWSAKIEKAEAATVTIEGLKPSEPVEYAIVEYTPLAAERKRGSATASGEGVNIVAGGVTTRASQGDFVFCAVGISFSGGSRTLTAKAPTVNDVEGGSTAYLAAALSNPGAENTTVTPEATEEGEGAKGTNKWATVTVDYRVLADEGGGPVTGKATGTVLFTGTATGAAKSVVTGKATGTTLFVGSSTATLKAVINGKASGAVLFVGTSKGSIAGALKGKASGVVTFTGTGSGERRSIKTGKATGQTTFTGAGTGTLRSNITGKASGTIIFTGYGKQPTPAAPHRLWHTIKRAVRATISSTTPAHANITTTLPSKATVTTTLPARATITATVPARATITAEELEG